MTNTRKKTSSRKPPTFDNDRDQLQLFENIYQAAFEAGQYSTALRAKESYLKHMNKASKQQSLFDQLMLLSPPQLKQLIQDIKQHL